MARPNGKYSRNTPWPSPGQRYGHLVVTSRGFDDKGKHQRFWCVCDCGKRKLIRGDNLQSGKITSCGHVGRGETLFETVRGYKCVETGEVFASASEALQSVGLSTKLHATLRSATLRPEMTLGEDPQTGEPLHWERADAVKEVKGKRASRSKESLNKKVVLLNTKEVFKSVTEAAIQYPQTDKTAISRCCNGERASAGKDEDGKKLVWMWYEEWNKEFR